MELVELETTAELAGLGSTTEPVELDTNTTELVELETTSELVEVETVELLGLETTELAVIEAVLAPSEEVIVDFAIDFV